MGFSWLVLCIAFGFIGYGIWLQRVLGITVGIGIAIISLRQIAGVPYDDPSPAGQVLGWLSFGMFAANALILVQYLWRRRQAQLGPPHSQQSASGTSSDL